MKSQIYLSFSECKGLALALCTFRSKKFGEAKVTKKNGITIIPSHFIHELFGGMGIKLYLCTQYIAHKIEKSRITHRSTCQFEYDKDWLFHGKRLSLQLKKV